MKSTLRSLLPILLCCGLAACKVPGDPGSPRFVWVDGGGVGALRYAVDMNGILESKTSRHFVHLMIIKASDVARMAAATPSEGQHIPVRRITLDIDCTARTFVVKSMEDAAELTVNGTPEAASYWVPQAQQATTGGTVLSRTIDLACLPQAQRSNAGEKAF